MDEQLAFGSYLRAERELRQIPLGEVAAATKIPLHTLRNLERGEWEKLPAEVFVKGFIRSYAQYLGLPPEEACGRYLGILAARREPQGEEQAKAAESEPLLQAIDVGGRRKIGIALLVIIVLILATITLSLFWRSGAAASTNAAGPTPPDLTSRG